MALACAYISVAPRKARRCFVIFVCLSVARNLQSCSRTAAIQLLHATGKYRAGYWICDRSRSVRAKAAMMRGRGLAKLR